MASCLKQIKLQDYVDGELSRAEAAEVAAHLAACERCRQVVADLQAVALPLRDLAAVAVPEALSERLLAAVAGLEPLAAVSCADAEEWLSEALDGRLDFTATQRLEAHLDGCAACARLAREWGVLVDGLRAVPPEPAPAGLLPRIREAVAASQPRPLAVAWRRFATSAAGFAAAAAILLTIMLRSPALLPPAPSPVVAVAPPAIERATPAVEAVPAARPAKAAAATAKPAAAAPTVASPVTRAQSLLAAARPAAQPAAARPVAVVTPRPEPVRLPTPAAPVAPVAPEVMPAVASGPVTLAALPPTARVVSEHRVSADTAPRVTMPAATPVDRPVTDAPAATVAALPAAKATPSAEPTAAPEPERPRPTWVSRPAVGEREVYRSEDRGTRLALARESLRTDMDRIDNWRPREWKLR